MEFKLIIRFLAPLFAIVLGLALKYSEKLENNPMKKYWLFFVLTGLFLLTYRIYKIIR